MGSGTAMEMFKACWRYSKEEDSLNKHHVKERLMML
jgi:hypothetical protein